MLQLRQLEKVKSQHEQLTKDLPAITWNESDVQLDAMSWKGNKLVYLDGSCLQGDADDGGRREL
eukprot:210270-Hanusia_phi.AAC.1